MDQSEDNERPHGERGAVEDTELSDEQLEHVSGGATDFNFTSKDDKASPGHP